MKYHNAGLAASRRGRPPASLTLVIERLLLVLKEGVGWRAIHSPELPWRTVYGHFRHWLDLGVFNRLVELLEWQPEQLRRIAAMDSTHVKVHRSGCNPQGGQQAQAIGVSRGGLNTKVHALVTGTGRPLKITFTAGNHHDNPQALLLIEEVCGVDVLIADKAYDAKATRQAVEAAGAAPCIPSKSNSKNPLPLDKQVYARRHVVENFWEVLKRCRRLATRYDKLLICFEAFLQLGIAVQHFRGQFNSPQFSKNS